MGIVAGLGRVVGRLFRKWPNRNNNSPSTQNKLPDQLRPAQPTALTAPVNVKLPGPGKFQNKLDQIPDGWIKVTSSNINAMRYDKTLRAMDEQFKDGRIARYFNVSVDEALILLTRSHGIHSWDIIRYRGKGNQKKHKKPWKYIN